MTVMRLLVASAILACVDAQLQDGVPRACVVVCEPVMDQCEGASAATLAVCKPCHTCLMKSVLGGKGGKGSKGNSTGGGMAALAKMVIQKKQCASNHRLSKTAYTSKMLARTYPRPVSPCLTLS